MRIKKMLLLSPEQLAEAVTMDGAALQRHLGVCGGPTGVCTALCDGTLTLDAGNVFSPIADVQSPLSLVFLVLRKEDGTHCPLFADARAVRGPRVYGNGEGGLLLGADDRGKVSMDWATDLEVALTGAGLARHRAAIHGIHGLSEEKSKTLHALCLKVGKREAQQLWALQEADPANAATRPKIVKACGGAGLGKALYAMLLAQTDPAVLEKQMEIVKACGDNLGADVCKMLFAEKDPAVLAK